MSHGPERGKRLTAASQQPEITENNTSQLIFKL